MIIQIFNELLIVYVLRELSTHTNSYTMSPIVVRTFSSNLAHGLWCKEQTIIEIIQYVNFLTS